MGMTTEGGDEQNKAFRDTGHIAFSALTKHDISVYGDRLDMW